MAAGVPATAVIFTAGKAFLVLDSAPELTNPQVVALGLVAIGAIVGYGLQRRWLARDLNARADELRQTGDPLPLVLERYRQFTIVGGGLLEAAAFCALAIYIVTGRPLALTAVGVGVIALVAHMPSRAKLSQLVEKAVGYQ